MRMGGTLYMRIYNYDQVLNLPAKREGGISPTEIDIKPKRDGFEYTDDDAIKTFKEQQIDYKGMKVDNMFYKEFEQGIKDDKEIVQLIEAGDFDTAVGLTMEKYIDKPTEYYTLEKLRKSLKIDRRITMRELLELMFFGNQIKGKEELMSDEFEKFLSTVDVSQVSDINALRYFFYAYISCKFHSNRPHFSTVY